MYNNCPTDTVIVNRSLSALSGGRGREEKGKSVVSSSGEEKGFQNEPSFSLGLGFSQQDPNCGTASCSDKEQEDNTPPGFIEKACEIADMIETCLQCDDLGTDGEMSLSQAALAGRVRAQASIPCAEPLESKNPYDPKGADHIPYLSWASQNLGRRTAKGRPIKETRLFGSPYADPFWLAQEGFGNRDEKMRKFWKDFHFGTRSLASQLLLQRTNKLVEKLIKLEECEVKPVLYNRDSIEIDSTEVVDFLTDGTVSSNIMSVMMEKIYREVPSDHIWTPVSSHGLRHILNGNIDKVHQGNPGLLTTHMNNSKYVAMFSTDGEHWWLIVVRLIIPVCIEIFSSKPENERTEDWKNLVMKEAQVLRQFFCWRFGGEGNPSARKYLKMDLDIKQDLPVHTKPEDSGLYALRYLLTKVLRRDFIESDMSIDEGDIRLDRFVLMENILSDEYNKNISTVLELFLTQ